MTYLEAFRMARAQLQIRHAHLSQCRVCGAEAQRFEEAVERIKHLGQQQLEETTHGLQIRPT